MTAKPWLTLSAYPAGQAADIGKCDFLAKKRCSRHLESLFPFTPGLSRKSDGLTDKWGLQVLCETNCSRTETSRTEMDGPKI